MGRPTFTRTDHYIVYRVGVAELLVLQAYAQKREDMDYDFVGQTALSAPLTPGAVNLPTPATSLPSGSYSDNTYMPLPSIPGVTNLWDILRNNEALEAFVGVAPSPLRVSLKQPTGYGTIELDQNVVPIAGTVPVTGLRGYDGFASPYDYPDDSTLMHTLKGISANFLLVNPVRADQNPNGVYPRFNLLLNRLAVFPVNDPTVVRKVVEGREPARWITLGNPFDSQISFSREAYGCGRFKRSIFQSPDWAKALTALGYTYGREG